MQKKRKKKKKRNDTNIDQWSFSINNNLMFNFNNL